MNRNLLWLIVAAVLVIGFVLSLVGPWAPMGQCD